MTWVKICGITNPEDALTSVEAGADALGFVFYDKSPRKIDPQTAENIVDRLPADVEKIGVFPQRSTEEAVDLARQIGLTGLQLYPFGSMAQFSAGPAVGYDFGELTILYVIPATLFLQEGFQWVPSQAQGPAVFKLLLDSSTSQQLGGTGQIFDWHKTAYLISTMQRQIDVVIAGGLTSANVKEAIQTLEPWGVDVASGVEARPGKKDPEKVQEFITAVRKAQQVH